MKDLMIGSLITHDVSVDGDPIVWRTISVGDQFVICQRGEDVKMLKWQQVEYLLLSPDWLKKAGYKEIGTGLWGNGSGYDIDFYKNGSILRLESSDDYVCFGPVFTYLHELQLLMAGLGHPLTFNK